MIVWVVGAGGLLGRSVADAVKRRAGWQLCENPALPWHDSDAIGGVAAVAFARLVDMSEREQQPWAVVWAAGSVVTSSPQPHIDRELTQLSKALDAMSSFVSTSSEPGLIFYASSAGGVYGGSENPPFTEHTEAVSISPYGTFKLAAERQVVAFAQEAGISSLVGRIANLYGPGQRLEKMQGLISHIAKAQYSVRPATIYVPLDNRRDYVFVTDCAELVIDALERARRESAVGGPAHFMKIFASGQAVTIGTLLGEFHAIAKARPNVMLGDSPAAALQTLNLGLRSEVWTDLDRRELTPLAAGIHATMLAVLAEFQNPQHSLL
jgi:UDP-glucose 4-epimerase